MHRSTPGLPVHHHLPEFTQHPAISSSVVPFSSCPQSLPASESFPMSQLFAWGGQSTGVSTLASFLPKNTQDWSFRMDWLDLLAVQGTLKSLLQHHSSKASILWHSAFFTLQLSHPYMTTGKNITLTRRTFVGKVMSLLLNMLSWLVITFLPRSKCLLISWLQSPSAVILEPPKISLTLFPLFLHLFPMKWWDQVPWSSFFECWANMLANSENSAVVTGLEKVSFHSNPKERQCQRMLKLPHSCTHLTC